MFFSFAQEIDICAGTNPFLFSGLYRRTGDRTITVMTVATDFHRTSPAFRNRAVTTRTEYSIVNRAFAATRAKHPLYYIIFFRFRQANRRARG